MARSPEKVSFAGPWKNASVRSPFTTLLLYSQMMVMVTDPLKARKHYTWSIVIHRTSKWSFLHKPFQIVSTKKATHQQHLYALTCHKTNWRCDGGKEREEKRTARSGVFSFTLRPSDCAKSAFRPGLTNIELLHESSEWWKTRIWHSWVKEKAPLYITQLITIRAS